MVSRTLITKSAKLAVAVTAAAEVQTDISDTQATVYIPISTSSPSTSTASTSPRLSHELITEGPNHTEKRNSGCGIERSTYEKLNGGTTKRVVGQEEYPANNSLQLHSSSSSSLATISKLPTTTTNSQNNKFYFRTEIDETFSPATALRGNYNHTTIDNNNCNSNSNNSNSSNSNSNSHSNSNSNSNSNISTIRNKALPIQESSYDDEIVDDDNIEKDTLNSNRVTHVATLALPSSPSPINDQISQLFPKCKPKHNNNNNKKTNRNGKINEELINLQENSCGTYQKNRKLENSVKKNTKTKSKEQQQYYKSVNIIKQSPPPQSTPSISTESLSSVTALNSTNPFHIINHNNRIEKSLQKGEDIDDDDDDDDNDNDNDNGDNHRTDRELIVELDFKVKKSEEDTILHSYKQLMDEEEEEEAEAEAEVEAEEAEEDEEEEKENEEDKKRQIAANIIPLKSTRPTSTISIASDLYQNNGSCHHHPTKESYRMMKQQLNNDKDMERKRSSLYERYHYTATTPIASTTPSPTMGSVRDSGHSTESIEEGRYYYKKQNPFIKDNYWEALRKQQEEHTTTATATATTPASSRVLNSPELNEKGSKIEDSENRNTNAYKRSQQNGQNGQHEQQQQHRLRLGNSPNNRRRSDHDPQLSAASYDVLQKRNNYNMQQMHYQQQQQQSKINNFESQKPPIGSYGDWSENSNERRRDRNREFRNNKSLLNCDYKERFTTAASIRESMTEQTNANVAPINSINNQSKEHRGRHQYNGQQKYHNNYHYNRDYPTSSQCQLIENGPLSGSGNKNPEIIYDDVTAKSWQNLQVTTDSVPVSGSINNEDPNNCPTAYRLPTTSSIISNNINRIEHMSSYITCNSPNSDNNGQLKQQSDFDQEDFIYITNNSKSNNSSNTNNNSRRNVGTNCERDRERKKYSNKDFRVNIEARQGIIEYEGSPRRIGKMANIYPTDDGFTDKHPQTPATINPSKVASPKSPKYGGGLRPGFPQRILSPPREATKYQQQQQQQDYHPVASAQYDNNAEDTSNDVSEIGTTSDLTVSDLISAANTIAPNQRNLMDYDENSIEKSLNLIKCSPNDNNDIMSTVAATTASYTMSVRLMATSPSSPSSSSSESVTVAATMTTMTATSPPALTSIINNPLSSIMAPATTTTTTIITTPIIPTIATKSSTFDYLYEFSETRKVLEEFFKCPSIDDKPIIENISDVDSIDIQYEFHTNLERDIDNNFADNNNNNDNDNDDHNDDHNDDDNDDHNDDNINNDNDHNHNDNNYDNNNDDYNHNDNNYKKENNNNDNNNDDDDNDINNTDIEPDILDDDDNDDDDDDDNDNDDGNELINMHQNQLKYYITNKMHQHQQSTMSNHAPSPTNYSYSSQYHPNEMNNKNDDNNNNNNDNNDDDDDEDNTNDDDCDDDDNDNDDNDDDNDISHREYLKRNRCFIQQQQHQQQTSSLSLVNHNNNNNNNNYAQCTLNNSRYGRIHNVRRHYTGSPLMRDFDYFLDTASRSSSGEQCEIQQNENGLNHNLNLNHNHNHHNYNHNHNPNQNPNHNYNQSRTNYQYSPDTTDYDSNCGDLDSLSGEGLNGGISTSCSNYTKYYASSMPVLEDGLSSGHTSDTENHNNTINNNNNNNNNNDDHNNNQAINSDINIMPMGDGNRNGIGAGGISMLMDLKRVATNNAPITGTSAMDDCGGLDKKPKPSPNDSFARSPLKSLYAEINQIDNRENRNDMINPALLKSPNCIPTSKVFKNIDPDLDSLYSISVFNRNDIVQMTPPPPAPAPHRKPNTPQMNDAELHGAPSSSFRELRPYSTSSTNNTNSPNKNCSNKLLLHSNDNGTGFAANLYNNNTPKSLGQDSTTTTMIGSRGVTMPGALNGLSSQTTPLQQQQTKPTSPTPLNSPVWLSRHLDTSSNKILLDTATSEHNSKHALSGDEDDIDTDLETDRLLGHQRLDDQGYYDENKSWERKPSRSLLSKISPKQMASSKSRNGYNALLSSTPEIPPPVPPKNLSTNKIQHNGMNGSISSPEHSHHHQHHHHNQHHQHQHQHQQSPGKTMELNGNSFNDTLNSSSMKTDELTMMMKKENCDKNSLASNSNQSDLNENACGNGNGNGNGSASVSGSASGSGSGSRNDSITENGCSTTTLINNGNNGNNSHSSSGSIPGSINNNNAGAIGIGMATGGTATVTAIGTGTGTGTGTGPGSAIGSATGTGTGSGTGPASSISGEKKVKKSKNKEGGAVLIEGVLFRAKYLGSTQLVCEGQPTKSTRMMQAEEAVSRIKAPDGDVQPSTEVDLFISTEKIMVLNTDLKEIMMDHALRTISYIADIGDLVVLMARRRFVPQDIDDGPKPNRTPKMICHVFESDEAQFIAQSIGQAFQVAYMEFLKANGIEDHRFVKEMDYQEVLNSQEIFGDELEIFAKKELQKEVVVPKAKGEILGVVIVESGWGSMLPTVVIANLMSAGAAARCGQLNIGDQLIAINGLSLVGLPLSTCQNYIKNTKNQTVVKFTVVPCPPVVEVKIKRPETKYQLGFSVQNGVICSLLRGGIAERGGVRVGHRIIEINNQSVVAVPHEKIVNLLATSVGEILMKTMPTSMFRLLTGQENPIFI